MATASSRLKHAARFIGGLVAGVIGSGTVAAWLFAVFDWLDVSLDPSTEQFGLIGWAAMLASWTAAEFVGQTLAANTARSTVVIWFVAAAHAAILLAGYYFYPHSSFLVGAPIGFIVAYRIKDSDLLFIGRRVPASSR